MEETSDVDEKISALARDRYCCGHHTVDHGLVVYQATTMIKKIVVGILGLLIGVGLVALLFYVSFLKEKMWRSSDEPLKLPQRIETK